MRLSGRKEVNDYLLPKGLIIIFCFVYRRGRGPEPSPDHPLHLPDRQPQLEVQARPARGPDHRIPHLSRVSFVVWPFFLSDGDQKILRPSLPTKWKSGLWSNPTNFLPLFPFSPVKPKKRRRRQRHYEKKGEGESS